MKDRLQGRNVAFLVANDGVEQVELTEPMKALQDAGAAATIVALERGKVQARNHLDLGDAFEADLGVGEAAVDDFDALVLPGGVANPDELRTVDEAVAFVGSFFDAGKPVAAICHAPWTLVEAGVIDGRTVTSWPSLRTDIRNAGGTWVDEEVVVSTDGPNTLITSRKPDDLPAFCARVVELFAAEVTDAGGA